MARPLPMFMVSPPFCVVSGTVMAAQLLPDAEVAKRLKAALAPSATSWPIQDCPWMRPDPAAIDMVSGSAPFASFAVLPCSHCLMTPCLIPARWQSDWMNYTPVSQFWLPKDVPQWQAKRHRNDEQKAAKIDRQKAKDVHINMRLAKESRARER